MLLTVSPRLIRRACVERNFFGFGLIRVWLRQIVRPSLVEAIGKSMEVSNTSEVPDWRDEWNDALLRAQRVIANQFMKATPERRPEENPEETKREE